jgi:hypothetical protein
MFSSPTRRLLCSLEPEVLVPSFSSDNAVARLYIDSAAGRVLLVASF